MGCNSMAQSPTAPRRSSLQIQLPYLKPARPILPPAVRRPHPLAPEFDLHTNFATLPLYNPQADRNLLYFFEKPRNRRLLESLNQEEMRKQKAREAHSHRSVHQCTSPRAEVSKTQFAHYMHSMKEKVQSEARER